ncbi:MAG: PLP-dependent aminotransferase family protein [Actinomycetota bacterium]
MREDWATSSRDLLIELRGTRRRAGLEDALREAVSSGRLSPGTVLPSSRALATELALARNTVADAYGQLVAEGWLTARQGSGTQVADRPAALAGTQPARRPGPAPGRRGYDLSSGSPDLAGFPRTAWLAASRKALTAAPNSDFGYPDPRGLPALRETLAHYLARVRGVRTTPDRIVVCSGFAQALSLLSATLRARGAVAMALEAYGLSAHRDAVRAAGLATTLLTVDASGARTDQLAGPCAAVSGAGPGAVLLTPAHQFPVGVPLAAHRRSAALRWARASGGMIIEDDYDGEFRYDRRPLGALQGLAPDLVAYAGTASKSLAPGLGLAWLALPPDLIDDVTQAKTLSDGYTGIFEQLALDEFIRSGGYDRHVRQSRLRYRRRRDRLVAAAAQRSPGVRVTGIAAGLHAVLELGGGLRAADEPAIVSRAARAGLSIQGLGQFRRGGPADDAALAALVLGYGTPPDHAFAGALDTLFDVLA